MEALEPRRLLATFVVDTLEDIVANDGLTSIREAVEQANANDGADTISFEPGLFDGGAGRLVLTGGRLFVTDSVELTGPGAALLTLDGGSASGVLSFTAGASGSTVWGVSVTNGAASEGAGIHSLAEGLTLDGVYVHANSAAVRGGGFFGGAEGVTIRNSTFAENTSGGSGGGAYLTDGSYVVVNSTFSRNVAQAEGGGMVIGADAVASVLNSTVFANRADEAMSGAAFGGAVAVTSDTRTDGSVVFVSTIFELNEANGADTFGARTRQTSICQACGAIYLIRPAPRSA